MRAGPLVVLALALPCMPAAGGWAPAGADCVPAPGASLCAAPDPGDGYAIASRVRLRDFEPQAAPVAAALDAAARAAWAAAQPLAEPAAQRAGEAAPAPLHDALQVRTDPDRLRAQYDAGQVRWERFRASCFGEAGLRHACWALPPDAEAFDAVTSLVPGVRFEAGFDARRAPLAAAAAAAEATARVAALGGAWSREGLARSEAGAGPFDAAGGPGPGPVADLAPAPDASEVRPAGAGSDEASWSAPVLSLLAGLPAALALAALYHRIAGRAALEQPTRRRIYDAVAAEPGIRVGTLQARLGLSYPTVRRHVRVLERCGFLEGLGEGQRRLFVRGALGPGAKRAAVAASTPACRAVLAYLGARRDVALAELCADLALPASTASVTVERLARAGLVTKRRAPRMRVALAPASLPAYPDGARQAA
jgi:DNA-binding transcriptional ArsR family regulator